jgi:hypothetical protein
MPVYPRAISTNRIDAAAETDPGKAVCAGERLTWKGLAERTPSEALELLDSSELARFDRMAEQGGIVGALIDTPLTRRQSIDAMRDEVVALADESFVELGQSPFDAEELAGLRRLSPIRCHGLVSVILHERTVIDRSDVRSMIATLSTG